MSDRHIGLAFVGVQALLPGALVALPSGNAWPRPAWLSAVGVALVTFASLRRSPDERTAPETAHHRSPSSGSTPRIAARSMRCCNCLDQ